MGVLCLLLPCFIDENMTFTLGIQLTFGGGAKRGWGGVGGREWTLVNAWIIHPRTVIYKFSHFLFNCITWENNLHNTRPYCYYIIVFSFLYKRSNLLHNTNILMILFFCFQFFCNEPSHGVLLFHSQLLYTVMKWVESAVIKNNNSWKRYYINYVTVNSSIFIGSTAVNLS